MKLRILNLRTEFKSTSSSLLLGILLHITNLRTTVVLPETYYGSDSANLIPVER